MDFKQLLQKMDSFGGKQQLNEGSKEDHEYYFGKEKKSGSDSKERETGTGHMAKKTDKGTQYTKKDLPGQDTSKDADTKAAEKKAKKKASEDIADMLKALNAIVENKAEVEEEKTEEGNEFSGALAKAKAAGEKEFEVDGKKYQVKESDDNDEDDKDDVKDDDIDESAQAVDLEECYGQAMMGGQPEQESGMSINASTDTRTGSKSLTVTAQGEAAEQLAQLLKLSGVAGPAAHDAEMEEAYANEPNPETQGIETQLAQGTDLNRPKTMHQHSYRQGDNPMAMREAEELAAIEQKLNEALANFKVMGEAKGSKPDFLDMDKDGNKKEPMKKALADKSKKKVSETQAVAEKAVSKQQQKFMGMVHAMQKGAKIKGASPELKKVAKTMSKKDVKDFAATKHKGLPKRVGEAEELKKKVVKQ